MNILQINSIPDMYLPVAIGAVILFQLLLIAFVFSKIRKSSTSTVGSLFFAFLVSEALLFVVSLIFYAASNYKFFPKTSVGQLGVEFVQRLNKRYPIFDFFTNSDTPAPERKNSDSNTSEETTRATDKDSNTRSRPTSGSNPSSGKTPVTSPSGTNKSRACLESESKVNTELDKVSACSVDSDCAVSDLKLGCPFGCYTVVNKSSKLDDLKNAFTEYQKSCVDTCVYKCLATPTVDEIKCVSKKCEDIRTLQK